MSDKPDFTLYKAREIAQKNDAEQLARPILVDARLIGQLSASPELQSGYVKTRTFTSTHGATALERRQAVIELSLLRAITAGKLESGAVEKYGTISVDAKGRAWHQPQSRAERELIQDFSAAGIRVPNRDTKVEDYYETKRQKSVAARLEHANNPNVENIIDVGHGGS